MCMRIAQAHCIRALTHAIAIIFFKWHFLVTLLRNSSLQWNWIVNTHHAHVQSVKNWWNDTYFYHGSISSEHFNFLKQSFALRNNLVNALNFRLCHTKKKMNRNLLFYEHNFRSNNLLFILELNSYLLTDQTIDRTQKKTFEFPFKPWLSRLSTNDSANIDSVENHLRIVR